MEKTKREIRKEKKDYEKPRIVYQQSLEATAGECTMEEGKGDAGCTVLES
jgi:hypothetical protein